MHIFRFKFKDSSTTFQREREGEQAHGPEKTVELLLGWRGHNIRSCSSNVGRGITLAHPASNYRTNPGIGIIQKWDPVHQVSSYCD